MGRAMGGPSRSPYISTCGAAELYKTQSPSTSWTRITMLLPVLLLVFRLGLGLAQYDPNTTPVPILKQINRHNEDGSYSYGYEAADGSYKIESKHPTGEVFGKYGFVDDTGNIREVEYGASRRGFEPVGTGINVPPSTLSGNSIAGPNEPDDDGQYKEDPSIYHTDPRYTNGERYDPVPRPGYQLRQHQPLQPAQRLPVQSAQRLQQQQTAYRPPPASKSVTSEYHQPAIPEYRPQYRSPYQRQYQPTRSVVQQPTIPERRFETNVPTNANLGSYSVQYK